jgi:integrase
MKVLEPIWNEKTETASRVRGRIESVLDWAKVRGYRSGENPARWRGHLDKLLPRRSKVAKVEHHAALLYADARAFMRELRAREGTAPKALEFLILTAARVSEAVNAKWDEIDLKRRLWVVPV